MGIMLPFEKAAASTHWPIAVSPVGKEDHHWLQSSTVL